MTPSKGNLHLVSNLLLHYYQNYKSPDQSLQYEKHNIIYRFPASYHILRIIGKMTAFRKENAFYNF